MAQNAQTMMAVMRHDPSMARAGGAAPGNTGVVPPSIPMQLGSRPSSALPAPSTATNEPVGGINPIFAQRILQAMQRRHDDPQATQAPAPATGVGYGGNGGNPWA